MFFFLIKFYYFGWILSGILKFNISSELFNVEKFGKWNYDNIKFFFKEKCFIYV